MRYSAIRFGKDARNAYQVIAYGVSHQDAIDAISRDCGGLSESDLKELAQWGSVGDYMIIQTR